jgi:rare lipoprotein A
MPTVKRISSPKARSLRAMLIAAMLGIAPLAASTAATPADGALSLEASAAAVEIMPAAQATLQQVQADSIPAESLPVATSLGSGSASYYASKFHGRRTASGEAFDNAEMTAAHRTLPFGSLVRVTNQANGRSVVVRINDRGPFTRGRLIDVSRAAAEELGLIARGHAEVSLELIEG